jgi:hypothetical protein
MGCSKWRVVVAAALVAVLSTPAVPAQSLTCGIKPIPEIGCRIGRCVNGAWEQICDSNPALSCGIKPIAAIGCRVGRCVGGE